MSTVTLPSAPPTMDEMRAALEALQAAEASYQELAQAEAGARLAANTALNRLNEAQKAVDRLLAQRREHAPFASEWRAKRRVPGGACG